MIDASELNRLAVELEHAGNASTLAVRGAVERGALAVKEQARQLASGIHRAPHYAASITYDVRATRSGWEAEIGPDKNRRQGPLGNLFEYGTSQHGPNAPVLGPALDRKGGEFVEAVADVTGDLL